jgi:hypothetical protein
MDRRGESSRPQRMIGAPVSQQLLLAALQASGLTPQKVGVAILFGASARHPTRHQSLHLGRVRLGAGAWRSARDDRSLPRAESTAARDSGRFLGSTCRVGRSVGGLISTPNRHRVPRRCKPPACNATWRAAHREWFHARAHGALPQPAIKTAPPIEIDR